PPKGGRAIRPRSHCRLLPRNGLGGVPFAGPRHEPDRSGARHRPRLGRARDSPGFRAAALSRVGSVMDRAGPRPPGSAALMMLSVIGLIFFATILIGVPIAFGMGLAGASWILFFEGIEPTILVRRFYYAL